MSDVCKSLYKIFLSEGYILHLAQSLYLRPRHREGVSQPGSHLFPSHLQPRETAGGMEVSHLSVRPCQHGAHRVQHPHAGQVQSHNMFEIQTSFYADE